ncbi:MAG: hypothetical protein IJX49_05735 [Clostridia bacterium]|nr:hypothetical protein [Clostridia bacterium]
MLRIFNVKAEFSQYRLTDIRLENLDIQAEGNGYSDENSDGVTLTNVTVTKVKING